MRVSGPAWLVNMLAPLVCVKSERASRGRGKYVVLTLLLDPESVAMERLVLNMKEGNTESSLADINLPISEDSI